MYVSPKMTMIASAADEGYHCPGQGCVAHCDSNAVKVVERTQ